MNKQYSSFSDFKNALNNWINQNNVAKYIDGTSGTKPPGNLYTSFVVEEIPCFQGIISFHKDTEMSAMRKVAKAEIKNFLIVPPAGNFKYWRLFFIDEFDKNGLESRNGLYAYLKPL